MHMLPCNYSPVKMLFKNFSFLSPSIKHFRFQRHSGIYLELQIPNAYTAKPNNHGVSVIHNETVLYKPSKNKSENEPATLIALKMETAHTKIMPLENKRRCSRQPSCYQDRGKNKQKYAQLAPKRALGFVFPAELFHFTSPYRSADEKR